MSNDVFEGREKIDTLDTGSVDFDLKPACSGLIPRNTFFSNTTIGIESFLINRFTDYFSPQLSALHIRISSLEDQIKNFKQKQPKQVFLNNLRSSKLSLNEPLFVIFEKNEAEIICDCPDIDLYGVGDTEQEAIVDFSASLEELFFTLKSEGEENLGSQLIYVWRFLKKIIKENKCN